MIEMLMKPKRAERRPWEMFFIGIFYASVSLLLVSFVFGKDSILKEASGLLVVLFTVICTLPFMYYIIKLEEGKDVEISDSGKLIKEHSKAIWALIWLFMGFIVAFGFWHLALPEQAGQNFNFQIKTYCAINSPETYERCLVQYRVPAATGAAIKGTNAVLSIFANNIYVLIFYYSFLISFWGRSYFYTCLECFSYWGGNRNFF